MKPVLETIDVHKTYAQTEALRGVHLQVEEGIHFALVGESGAGKSTLLKMFNALVVPTSGTVRVEGKAVAELDPVQLRRRVGYVSQEGGLLPHWTVFKNACLVPSLLGWEGSRQRQAVEQLFERVGMPLERYGSRFPSELSGGQKQRVALVRAFAADPKVILLDEPFGALDPLTRFDLQQQMLSLNKQYRKTTLLVTHDLREAFLLGDRVAVMKDGQIQQWGTPEELRRHPATPYVKELLRRGLGEAIP